MTPQIIVYGLDSIGYGVLCLLRQQQAAVVGVNRYSIPGEADIIVGDLLCTETLRRAGVEMAQTIVIANNDDATNLEILLQARLLNPRIRIINRLFNHSLGDRLDRTLVDHTTMSVADLSAPIFTFAAMSQVAIGHLQLFQSIWPIYEERIHRDHPWCNRLLSELWNDRSRMLIYYLTSDAEISLIEAMSQDRRLQSGDRLIIGTHPNIATYRSTAAEKIKKSFLWLEQFRRYLRPGLIVSFFLLMTIAIATFTYILFGWEQSTLVDALYFSVGMITGAGGNEDVAERSSALLKVFTAVMMLVGAGVIGIFYALLNDLVLGSRLRAFWDVARVPSKGHYIICGLGGVGIKTAQQLLAQGYKVVVIERDDDSRFLSMARSQQIPVILADASLPLTLQTANIAQATALIAVTNDDMVNLEIALTAKELAAHLSIVVRSNNPTLANRMSQVFDFTTVLNPFEIAASTFAAAALGGRILGSGVTGEILWIALSLLITPTHAFCHRLVQEIAIEADLVPLYLQSTHESFHGWNLLNAILEPGDVLHLTIPAKNIERLWCTRQGSLEYQQ
ncbi:TrkA-N domain family [Synechococcus sp. PCC 7335]|uniref:NAD-binding protein n=1 Tax=Synechococcus sp. (strain ATCC 29403 / PCC 7335) TaxID=91464 RepID=UPI00017ECE39|nr:NAD-binding protein [Synechococcus sp. PCC 7335]EDX86604.1 TrkA-N domain family [Synechococcus sp. PCC 7335]